MYINGPSCSVLVVIYHETSCAPLRKDNKQRLLVGKKWMRRRKTVIREVRRDDWPRYWALIDLCTSLFRSLNPIGLHAISPSLPLSPIARAMINRKGVGRASAHSAVQRTSRAQIFLAKNVYYLRDVNRTVWATDSDSWVWVCYFFSFLFVCSFVCLFSYSCPERQTTENQASLSFRFDPYELFTTRVRLERTLVFNSELFSRLCLTRRCRPNELTRRPCHRLENSQNARRFRSIDCEEKEKRKKKKGKIKVPRFGKIFLPRHYKLQFPPIDFSYSFESVQWNTYVPAYTRIYVH